MLDMVDTENSLEPQIELDLHVVDIVSNTLPVISCTPSQRIDHVCWRENLVVLVDWK